MPNMELTVDTGAVTIDIKDKKGKKLGEFDFIPTDSNIIKRYEEVANRLEKIEVNEDMGSEDMLALSDKLEEEVDYLLGTGTAKKIFSTCGALTVVANGDFYIENVMDGIGSLITKVFDERAKKKMARLKKATSKYHK